MTVTDRGTSGNAGSEAATAFSPATTIAAGSAGVLYIAADNANGSSTNFPVGPLIDSAGNSWYRILDNPGGVTANATLESAAYYCPSLTTQLTSGGNLTTTYTAANVVAKVGSFIEVAPATAGNWIVAGRDVGNLVGGGTTVSAATTASPMIGQLTIGGCGVENGTDGFAGDADTSNGSWSTMQHAVVGSGTSGMGVLTQWKVQTTATGSQTFNPTFSTNDGHAEVVVFQEADSKVRGFDGNATSQASTTTILSSLSIPMTSGSTAVLAMALDNAGLNGAVTNVSATAITDSQGNTWTLRQDQIFDNGAASAGAEVAVWTSTLTHGLTRQDTMTVTYGGVNVAAKAWALYEFSNATAYANSGNGGGATGSTPTITTGSITTPDIVVGVLSSESDNAVTIDSDTSNGNWSQGAVVNSSGTGTGSMTLAMQYKATTGTATQTYNPTLGGSQDSVLAWVELTVPAAASTATKIPTIPTIGTGG